MPTDPNGHPRPGGRPPRRRAPIWRGGSVGLPPGTLQAPTNAHPTRIELLDYSGDHSDEAKEVTIAEVGERVRRDSVTWINVVGLEDVQAIEQLGTELGLHHLAMEDVFNVGQRPKAEDYGEFHFIVARMPVSEEYLQTEQISIFLGPSYVLTLQERPGDCFDEVRERIRGGRPRIRGGGPDYLVYAILDAVVDSYFPLLESVANELDRLELRIQESPKPEHVEELHSIKRDLAALRRYLWPLRELVTSLMREDSEIFTEKTQLFMRDCLDHVSQAVDLVEQYREMAGGLLDVYLSLMSQKMNEIMKFLTIMSTIFIPLGFIAGLYGMNFDAGVSRWNMPELSLPFGYPMALGAMAACAGGLLLFFRSRGWFD